MSITTNYSPLQIRCVAEEREKSTPFAPASGGQTKIPLRKWGFMGTPVCYETNFEIPAHAHIT